MTSLLLPILLKKKALTITRMHLANISESQKASNNMKHRRKQTNTIGSNSK